MSRARALIVAVCVVASLPLTTVANADGPAADVRSRANAVFEAAVDEHVGKLDLRKVGLTAAEKNWLEASFSAGLRRATAQQAGAQAVAIEDEGVATLPRLASLALKTDLQGVESGVSVAPLVLFGLTDDDSRGFSLSVGSLKEDKFRVGLSFQRSWTPDITTPVALGFDTCRVNLGAYTKDLLAYSNDYVSICEVISQLRPDAADTHGVEWLRAVASCGLVADDRLLERGWELPAHETRTGQQIFDAAAHAPLISKVSALLRLWDIVSSKLPPDADLKEAASRLRAVKDAPSATSCISAEEIIQAAMRRRWRAGESALGVSVTGDFHPFKWGANPDASMTEAENKPLPSGELARAEARLEYRRSRRGLSWIGGIGAKWERDELNDPLVLSVRPSFGLQCTVLRLDGGAIEERGHLVLGKDGSPPPVLVLGLDVVAGVAVHNKPAEQSTPLDELGVKIFADVRVNKDLAFRIGVPFTAKIERTSKDENMNKKELQWSLAAIFVSTVVEL